MKYGKLIAAGFLAWLAWRGYQVIKGIETNPSGLRGGVNNIDPSTGRPLY